MFIQPLRIIRGPMDDPTYNKGGLSFRLQGHLVEISIPASRAEYFHDGGDIECAARRNIFLPTLACKAYRLPGDEVRASRTSDYWIWILVGVFLAGVLAWTKSLPSISAIKEGGPLLVCFPIVFAYSVFGILETRRAVRLLRNDGFPEGRQ
jgi:hypothetical protein